MAPHPLQRLSVVDFVLSAIAGLFVASAAGIAVRPRALARTLVYGATGILCLALCLWALTRLTSADGPAWAVLPVGLPWLSAHFRVDALSALFLVIVNLGGVTASLFGWGYERAHAAHDGHAGPTLPPFPLFLAGMNLVLMADDAFVFLVSWEFMSLASWVLVLSAHREAETERAARVYLIMAVFGTTCLLLAFGLLAGAGGHYSFEAMRAHPPAGWAIALAVVLALTGAGSKAGLVPLHVWLPLAHPAAPSHVSALMSGVMTKVAVYGLIRILFDLVGQPSWWWGGLMMGLGAITAVLGVLQTMTQEDVKRLLAYSTVENVGFILIGLGVALAFRAEGLYAVYALALCAALFHAFNHSLFKSLLFYGAGAVLTATGSRDLNRLGGLARTMPQTAVLVLIGSAAISALPPFNGFVGEWLLFQSILNGPQLPPWALKVEIALVAAAAALAAALAAACFVRFYGIAFLGRARSDAAREAREVGWTMRLAMAVPALLCLAAGVLPMPVIHLIEPAIRQLGGMEPFNTDAGQALTWLMPRAALGNAYNGLVLLAAILLLAALTVAAIHRFASNRSRRSIPWGCGHLEPDPAGVTQYTALSAGQPIRRAMGSSVFQIKETVDMPDPGDTGPSRFELTMRDPAWTYLFDPLARAVNAIAGRMNVLQFLSIRRYLALMFFALVALLVIVAAGQQ
jgi:hydrogenase-4 component B